jgi:2-octaprenyl-6-methoxyphenol hydroxylase
MSAAAAQSDVLIVGGGMVGASLGLALAATSLRVAIVEPVLPGAGTQPSFDDRCTALANGSRRMLETLGAWPAIAPQATAIQTIHVSDAGKFGSARIEAAPLDLPALGYTAPNSAIGAALWQALRAHPQIQLIAPARVIDAHMDAAGAEVRLQTGSGAEAVEQSVGARLVVAADGDRSLIRERAGLRATELDYAQVAIVANVAAERRAAGIAYERFGAAAGPLALLPRPDGHYTVVWSVARGAADALVQQPDHAFLASLQQAFGWRVGAFTRVGRRAGYPLLLRRATQLVGPRTVLVGNAAQSLHPVAGQGFNLGLRDAATLAELLAEAAAAGSDPGAGDLLARYQQQRLQDRAGMIGFTDTLVRLFALSFPGAATLRSAGLLLFDALPAAKRGLSGVSWGFGARTPRLLRGLPAGGDRQ